MSQSLRRPARVRARRVSGAFAVGALLGTACSDPTSTLAPRGRAPRELPVTGVLTVAPHGSDTAAGTLREPLSLEKAVAKAHAGTTIQLLPGTYRTGSLVITQPVNIQAAPGAKVVLSGSEPVPAERWEPAGSGWRTRLVEHPEPAMVAAAERAPAGGSADLAVAAAGSRVGTGSAPPGSHHLAFVDGKALTAARSATELAPGTYFADTVGKWLYVGANPATHVVEASTHRSGITLAAPNSTVSGVVMEHFSDIGLRVSASNVTIQYSNFSYNGLIGLDINGVWNVTVRNNTITHNGEVGIEASHSSNVTVESNNISNNNTRHYNESWAAAGIKVTSSNYFTVRNNWVADNAANGLWVDAGTSNTTIAGNQVLRNKCYGIYFELSNGALIVGNIAHDNGQAGIGVHFTANARIYNNTLVNNGTDLDVSAAYNRSPYDLSHATIVNNLMWNSTSRLMVNLYRYNGCNSWVYSQVDYNGYYRPSGGPQWEVNWCNSWYGNLWSFHRGTGYEAHGLAIDGGGDPFFVSVRNEDYRLHSGSPAIRRGVGLPPDAAAALGVRPWTTVNLGAL